MGVFSCELNRPKLPLVMGHEIIGTVVKKGLKVERFSIGDRVGVPQHTLLPRSQDTDFVNNYD